MGRLKLLHFGLGAPELFASEAVNPRGQGDGFENTLRNIASNKGLAYLVSPQIGEFWKTMVLLKPTYLQQSKWSGYKRLKNSSFKALLNFEVLDKSNEEVEDWEECVGYPGIKLLMPRSLKIKVRYQSERKYEEVEEEAKGFEARVMQQAHDHLQAIDPLMLAKEITIIDQQLKQQHKDSLNELFSSFTSSRAKSLAATANEQNPYRRTPSFNRLRQELTYCITDHSQS